MRATIRVGSDFEDIEEKEFVNIWFHNKGKIYIKKSIQFAFSGWKINEKDFLIDYWGKIWYRLMPVNDLFLERNDFN